MEELIKKYEKKLDELIKNELEEKTKEIFKNDLNKEIEEKMISLDMEIDIIRKRVLDLFKKGLKKELEKGKYTAEIDFIVNFSFYEKMKIKIYNLFDANNYKKFAIHSLFSSLLIAAGIFLSPISFYLFGIYTTGILVCTFYKRYKKELNKRLDECEEKFQINFSRMRIKFSRIYKNSLSESKNKFKELLSLSCTDLSAIEEKKWKTLIKQYRNIKENILNLSKENHW